jgi:hypothetical protein
MDSSLFVASEDEAGMEASRSHGKMRKADPLWIDKKRVDEAAAWISEKIAATLRRGAEDVGEYLLEAFFSGDPELARSKNPYKNASYRALAEKCGTAELPVSKSWLNNAVGIALMLRQLPDTATAFRRLPPSYQQTLLPLRDPDKIEEVAKQAMARELSFRELRQVVAEKRAREEVSELRAGRATPGLIKALKGSLRLLRTSDGKPLYSAIDVKKLDEWQRKDANAFTQELLAELKDLNRKLS